MDQSPFFCFKALIDLVVLLRFAIRLSFSQNFPLDLIIEVC